MLDPKPYILPFLVALGLSLIFTPVVRKIALRFGFTDEPDKRKVHKKTIARLGGLAIFLSFALATAIFCFARRDLIVFAPWHEYNLSVKFTGIVVGAVILVITGLIDDKKTLSPQFRLIAQIIAALCVIVGGTKIDYLNSPVGGVIDFDVLRINIGAGIYFSPVADIITLIWIVGIINVINFFDGLDGLAAGVSFFAALSIFFISLLLTVFQPATALFSLILAGAILGFIPYNFNPAKIFMGDSGSLFLGYSLAVLAIISGAKMATALLVLGFPIIDGLLVVLRRVFRGESPFQPDKTHLHHRLLAVGMSVKSVVIFLWLISLAFGFLGIISTTYGKMVAIIALLGIMAVIYLALYIIEGKQNAKTNY